MNVTDIIIKYFPTYAFTSFDTGETILVVKTDYIPYADPGEGYFLIDAFYPAANAAYFKADALVGELNEAGFEAEKLGAHIYKDLVVKSGLARLTRLNSLAYSDDAGSRFVIGVIVISDKISGNNEQGKMNSEQLNSPLEGCPRSGRGGKAIDCATCLKCIKACPTGAITKDGMDRSKCLRQYMQNGEYPDEAAAKAAGRRLWGCDICQACCPANGTETAPMPDELKELLKIEGFVENASERVKGLGPYIGYNFARTRKLEGLAKQITNYK